MFVQVKKVLINFKLTSKGLFDLAVHFYKKCLDLPCTFPDQKEIYDLKRFAAYNLVTIYKHNGANEMARNVMRKYLTI